jgi:hypothetical protein
MKLADALEQAVRALLAPNGSSRNQTRPTRPVPSETGRSGAEGGDLALRVEEATSTTPLTGSHAPSQPEPPEPMSTTGEAELVELERAAAVVERLGLGFHLGSAVERIALAADDGRDGAQRLREAAWLIERYLELLERRPVGADLHLTMMRLAREGDTIAGLQALAGALEHAPAAPAALPPSTPEPEHTSAPAQPSPTEHPSAEHMILMPQTSVARELFLATARALLVVAAVVGIVLALTLIAQLH